MARGYQRQLRPARGPNRRADGLNASYSSTYQAGESIPDYDDLLVWIGRPLLIARMAQAGRL